MKKRVIAALAAVGLVAAMSGFGTLSAAADEIDETPAVVEETTTTPDETTTETTTEESTETTEEESTEESTEETTKEESTEESTEETTEEESKSEESALPVVEGYTEEQVAQAQALIDELGLGESAATARFSNSWTICHADKWGWETKDVDLFGYVLHWLFDPWDIMPGVFGHLDKNLWTDFGGLTGQQIYDNDCSKKVWVYHAPEAGENEECWDGAAQPGSIWVKYTWNLYEKGSWVITGPDFSYEVPFEPGWIEVPVSAGEYAVEFVPYGGWHIKHGGPYWIEIDPAINCECTVNEVDEVSVSSEKLVAEDIIIPLTPCAEAEVEVTPPTCEAASTLVLGDTYLAEWGEPEYTGSHYTVTAYADPGYRFYPAANVPADGLIKVFEGDLAPKLTNCGALPVTGAGDTGTPLWLAGLAVIAGIGALVVSTRRGEKVIAE